MVRQSKRSYPDSGGIEFGFTILELLLVMAVIFILSGIAIPAWMTSVRSYRIRNDAQLLVAELAQARTRAGANFSRTSVLCNSTISESSCNLQIRNLGDLGYSADAPFKVVLSPGVSFATPSDATVGAGVLNTSAFSPNTQATTAPIQCMAVAFNSRGYPIYDSTVGAGTACLTTPTLTDGAFKNNYAIYLGSSTGNLYLAVVVDPSGRASVWTWDGSQWTNMS